VYKHSAGCLTTDRFDKRLYRVYSPLSKRLHNPCWQPVWQPVVSCKRGFIVTYIHK